MSLGLESAVSMTGNVDDIKTNMRTVQLQQNSFLEFCMLR